MAAASALVAEVTGLPTQFDHRTGTIAAADQAKALESLAKVEALIAESACRAASTFKADVPDDAPFHLLAPVPGLGPAVLRAELGKLQKAISDAVAGMEGVEGTASDRGPLFGILKSWMRS